MSAELLLQYLFSGLTYGSIYAVVAIGFNIIYNSTGIINFAQGEFVMLGAMTAYSLSQFLPLPVAVLLAVLLTTAVGFILELIFIRSLYKTGVAQLNAVVGGSVLLTVSLILPLSGLTGWAYWSVAAGIVLLTLTALNLLWFFFKPFRGLFARRKKPDVLQMIIITIGLSILIREIALQIWGEQVRTVPFFTGNESSSISILGAHFSPQILWVFGVTALIVVSLSLFFKFTLTGQAMRGCSANREGASLCGINTRFMVSLSFALSAGIGALAGCVVAPLTQTHYAAGSELAIKGFTVAVFGGLGNSVAAVFAGLILGILESFVIIVFPEAYKDVVTIVILLAVLFIKPSGLFGSKETGRLKEF